MVLRGMLGDRVLNSHDLSDLLSIDITMKTLMLISVTAQMIISLHRWHTTHWSICSKSCGNGSQTRQVICRKKVNLFDYGASSNCSADTKPSLAVSFQPCNVIACPADWDTEEGFVVSKTSY